jgi:hypothetical protein
VRVTGDSAGDSAGEGAASPTGLSSTHLPSSVRGPAPYVERERWCVDSFWFFKACNKALQGDAKLKYFQHAGALLTADGTDDDLIKLEGTPPGYRIQI